ncbi:MAG TPA: acyloxyacyl hydrolase [Telmatospirillum sp.]|nr:acyloxyacyl hydrolase [Telmatospirillum sp.]
MATVLIAVILSASPRTAGAGEVIDEIKLGVLNHDVAFLGHHKENGIDTNIEALAISPDLLSIIGAPRPDIGISINSAGKTDQLYGGLTWIADLVEDVFLPKDGIYLGGSLGGSANDGKTDGTWRTHKSLGSALLFRESAEIGYRFHGSYNLSLIVDHSSDGGLSSRNQGLTNAGARLGIMF